MWWSNCQIYVKSIGVFYRSTIYILKIHQNREIEAFLFPLYPFKWITIMLGRQVQYITKLCITSYTETVQKKYVIQLMIPFLTQTRSLSCYIYICLSKSHLTRWRLYMYLNSKMKIRVYFSHECITISY
jgi:hypothetical protein